MVKSFRTDTSNQVIRLLSRFRSSAAQNFFPECRDVALIIVPSLDVLIYQMIGNGQYDPTLTDVPQPEPSHGRDDWKPIQSALFVEGSRAGDDGIRRVLEMICAALIPK